MLHEQFDALLFEIPGALLSPDVLGTGDTRRAARRRTPDFSKQQDLMTERFGSLGADTYPNRNPEPRVPWSPARYVQRRITWA